MRQLTDGQRRVAPGDLASLDGGAQPGVYAWWADPNGATAISTGLGLRVRPGLIYAGQAGAGSSSATLGSRIRDNHLGSNIYASTLRLTLAAVLREELALEPIGGRRMTRDGEIRLTQWMGAHLKVSIAAYEDRLALDVFESDVLDLLDPPLNLAKRPSTSVRQKLSILRRVFTGDPPTTPGKPGHSRKEGRGAVRSMRPSVSGLTPEELATELGLQNAKSLRSFLRREFPRPASDLWSPWGILTPEMERAIRNRFGRRNR